MSNTRERGAREIKCGVMLVVMSLIAKEVRDAKKSLERTSESKRMKTALYRPKF